MRFNLILFLATLHRDQLSCRAGDLTNFDSNFEVEMFDEVYQWLGGAVVSPRPYASTGNYTENDLLRRRRRQVGTGVDTEESGSGSDALMEGFEEVEEFDLLQNSESKGSRGAHNYALFCFCIAVLRLL